MVPGLKSKTNERSRRKETDDLLDFTGSKGWFYTAAFCRELLSDNSGGQEERRGESLDFAKIRQYCREINCSPGKVCPALRSV